MAEFRWDEETMGTGVESIDQQHQALIQMLNELTEAGAGGAGTEELRRMMAFLADYANTHFAHEEDLMAQHRCPFAEKNQDAHATFLAELEALNRRFEQEGPSPAFALDVQQKLLCWLTGHIRNCDTQLRSCVVACKS